MAVVEFARNVLNMKDANSSEFDKKSKNQVIHIMEEQKNIDNKGGTMRLRKLSMHIKRRNIGRRSIWNKGYIRKT